MKVFNWRLLLVAILLVTKDVSAHGQFVHQRIVREAYNFLVMQKGEIPALRAIVGMDLNGIGDPYDMWSVGLIAGGAYHEDEVDALWGTSFFSATITHFYDADANDDAVNTLDVYGDVPNAFYKARAYAWNGNNNVKMIGSVYALELQQQIVARTYHWDDLFEFYKSGHCISVNFTNQVGDVCQYPQGPHEIVMENPSRTAIAAEAIGRIAHLLGDMSVPAHAHTDWHPTGDYYDDYMHDHQNDTFNDPGFGPSQYNVDLSPKIRTES